MTCIETNRPISGIFEDLVNQVTALVRKEGQLARAEMSEKIGEIGMAAGLLVGGVVLLILALVRGSDPAINLSLRPRAIRLPSDYSSCMSWRRSRDLSSQLQC